MLSSEFGGQHLLIGAKCEVHFRKQLVNKPLGV